MGEYNEASCGADLATSEQDMEVTIETMERMIASLEKIFNFTKSTLYEHMEFKETNEEFFKELHENLLTCFRDEETYGYMKMTSVGRSWYIVKQICKDNGILDLL